MRQESTREIPSFEHGGMDLLGKQQMLNKVPQVTIFFWIIKVLCTTVGETASDFLNVNLGFGLTGTAVVAGILLAIVLFVQFRSKKYIPAIYWLAIVLISIFGTLVTDIMTDAIGVPLELSTIVFSAALMLTFAIWYRSEKTLSMHSIVTSKREAFYWLAILFTFALGTAAGDLMAESLGLGYLVTGLIVVAVIVVVVIAWRMGLDDVLGFWVVYVMTRPLGASLGDYLTQPPKYSGLGLGATVTTAIFMASILFTVAFLSITKLDRTARKPLEAAEQAPKRKHSAMIQTIAVVLALVLAGGVGYYFRHMQMVSTAAAVQTASADENAYADFIQIEQSALDAVNAGDFGQAKANADDLEYTWDQAESTLKPADPVQWDAIDQSIDAVLRQLRAVNPDATACVSAINDSLAAMQ